MPKPQAIKIYATEKQRMILEKFSKGTHTETHYKNRSTIILSALEGFSNSKISEKHKISRNTIIQWRNRWSESSEELDVIEKETPHKLKNYIKKILSDKYRSGKPVKFKTEQVAHIISLACQSPESLGVPLSHWTPKALRIKVIEENILDDISVRQVGRFLKRSQAESSSIQRVVKP